MDKINKWTKEQLTCPECATQGVEFVAKDMRGLNGHRMFKHGVHPSAPQLPLEQQDRLVTNKTLEQRISTLEEQLGLQEPSDLSSSLSRLLGSPDKPVLRRVIDINTKLSQLKTQLKSATSVTESQKIADSLKTELARLGQRATDNIASLRRDLNLVFLAISSSKSSSNAREEIDAQVKDAESVVAIARLFEQVDRRGRRG